MNTIKEQILDISRQNKLGPLTEWFDQKLDEKAGVEFVSINELEKIKEDLIAFLKKYSETFNINNVVIGMSGGVDSALTASLFKEAGWEVHGITMPIYQNFSETARAKDAINALGINGYEIDLSSTYENFMFNQIKLDYDLDKSKESSRAVLIRQGNIRARLRMITLYNYASRVGGLVASTDNFSELASGFWTLHGDVGDLSPIQSLYKSWEVPMIAKLIGVPESIWRATPTDGLGIDSGDESQFGFSYLELDIILSELQRLHDTNNLMCYGFDKLKKVLKIQEGTREESVFDRVTARMKGTWYKRKNPFNVSHPIEVDKRYNMLETFDNHYCISKLEE